MDYAARNALLKLHYVALRHTLHINDAVLDDLIEDLGQHEVDTLKRQRGSHQDIFAQFIETIRSSQRDTNILSKLAKNLNRGTERQIRSVKNSLLCTEAKDFDHYILVLRNYEKLLPVLDASHVADVLETRGFLSPQSSAVIQCGVDTYCKFNLLITKLPYYKAEWYRHFMDAVSEQLGAEFVAEMDPNYQPAADIEEDYGGFGFSNNNENDPVITEAQYAKMVEDQIQRAAAAERQRLMNSRRNVEPVVLQDFQHELAQHAVRGKNCIICAPTGCGKTIVACYIVNKMLEARCNAKIAFFVPSQSLVDQQWEVVKKYVPASSQGIKGGLSVQTGARTYMKKHLMRDNRVIIMTPQVLLNELQRFDDRDRISLREFDLLIFDECHHCLKNHPYYQIMMEYDQLVHSGGVPAQNMPQVVGLTASTGVGKAKERFQAVEFVKDQCARMYTHKVCMVEKHKEQLLQMVPTPQDSLELVSAGTVHNSFNNQVIQIMKGIEADLQPLLNKLPGEFAQYRTPPGEHSKPAYQNFVCSLLRRILTIDNACLKRALMTHLEYLKMFHIALTLNALVPTRYAFSYLNSRVKELEQRKSTAREGKMLKSYHERAQFLERSANDPQYSKVPIAEKLKAILIEEHKRRPEGGDSNGGKTIVFVQTRDMTQVLRRFMLDEPELRDLEPVSLVGFSGKNVSSDQKEALDKFRSGVSKVMIATSVAEEGLDIPECNLVIKYDFVTHEKALVQRRGRGRAEGSRSILLTFQDKLAQKEILNLRREILMKEAVALIGQKSEENFLEDMETRRQEIRKTRRIDEAKKAQKRELLVDKKYQVLCSKCDRLLCSSDHVKRIEKTHFVCILPDIWSLVQMTQPEDLWMHDTKAFDSGGLLGKVSCSNCHSPLGRLLQSEEILYPTLAAESVILQHEGEKVHARKWADIQDKYFHVSSASVSERAAMAMAHREQLRAVQEACIHELQEARKREARKREKEEQAAEGIWVDPEEKENQAILDKDIMEFQREMLGSLSGDEEEDDF